MVFTQKMIWQPLNFGIFLEKVYKRLNENRHEISIENSKRQKKHLNSRDKLHTVHIKYKIIPSHLCIVL